MGKYEDALRQHGSYRKAARALNISVGTFGDNLKNERFPRPPRVKVIGERASAPGSDAALEEALAQRLRKSKKLSPVEELSNIFDVGPKRISDALESLRRRGHNIIIASGGVYSSPIVAKGEPMRIDVRKLNGKTFTFGLVSDEHLGSAYARLDVLNAMFDIFAERGIRTVYECGNMIDGERRFNKSDLLVHGMEAQALYFARNYPARKGIETFFVTGDDHEGWYTQDTSINIGRYLEEIAQREGRDDLHYLGHMEHDIVFAGRKQKTIMRLTHPGGGSAYAISYAAQKIVESYSGSEKPNILLMGHYHKSGYFYIRGVHCVLAGTCCDQTPFMRKNKLAAHVGGWVIELTINDDGMVTRFRPEWIPFHDRAFYGKAWSYKNAA
jgi:hypothetical protein